MTKTRLKVSLPLLTTRDDAEATMNDLALTVANQRRTALARDKEVLAINDKYAGNLAACEQSIKQFTDQLRAWAEANPEQFPKDRKSIKLTSGTCGFRTGTPKLSLLNRAWSWDKVLSALRDRLPGFIRVKEEPDKEALLAAHASNPDCNLAQVGVRVTQDESFFVEPDLTQFEQRLTAAAS